MTSEIRHALETLMAAPGARAIAEDYLAQAIAEAKRRQASVIAADSETVSVKTVAIPDAFTLRYSHRTIGQAHIHERISLPIGGTVAASDPLRINDAVSVLAPLCGASVEMRTGRTADHVTTRKTSNGTGITDRRSSVVPAPAMTGARNTEASAGVRVSFRMARALRVLAPDVRLSPLPTGEYLATVAAAPVSDVWQAIATVMAEGFRIPTPKGIRAIPFRAVAAARTRDAAHKAKTTWNPDRTDDVISSALERAHRLIGEMFDAADPGDIVTHDGTAHAPVGMFAGAFVTRDIRCGKCEHCQHNGSRYVVGACVDPGTVVEYTDAQRIISRSVYAAAAASLSDERYAAPTATGEMPDAPVLAESPRDCGHGAKCQRAACRALNVMHAARVFCEATGEAVIAPNGSASVAYGNAVAVAYGHSPSKHGRAVAFRKVRAALESTRDA